MQKQEIQHRGLNAVSRTLVKGEPQTQLSAKGGPSPQKQDSSGDLHGALSSPSLCHCPTCSLSAD